MGNFILVAYDRQAGSSFNSQSPTRSPIVFALLLCFSITNPQRRNRAFGYPVSCNVLSSAKVDAVGASGGGSCQPHRPFPAFLTLARVGGARRACPSARLDAGDVHLWARQASDRNKFPKRSSQKLVRPIVPRRKFLFLILDQILQCFYFSQSFIWPVEVVGFSQFVVVVCASKVTSRNGMTHIWF